MRKLIAAINITLDGFCDHTAILPDEEIHQHYTELLGQGDAILYDKISYPQSRQQWFSVCIFASGQLIGLIGNCRNPGLGVVLTLLRSA